ncbi:hypothetical protein EST38_g1220 [Candolleomyces aberdarensis]|uniref:Endoglucanase n=1 Tax=Candolleomyces aberdarensis TaxID=2316362 RepID=A0A4Q2DXW5_9AGAR|nr:hypothetical protein EST38_g1220 [Candolleomyces aberdarensis]
MLLPLLAFALHTASTLVAAQLALPSQPWLPPSISDGASPSNQSYPNSKWSTLVGNLLYFYEAQRSGELPQTNRVSWRNASALDDGREARVDLSGGYYDAGGYDVANQTAYLDDMLRWGLDWLVKAHTNESTLYVLVASKDVDNSYWGGDRSIPSPRPVYQVNDTYPGTDVAAQTAAAFAACSNLYGNRALDSSTFSTPASLQDNGFSDTLLTHAQQLYAFAVNATGGRKVYQKSVPQVADAYGSSDYGDELAIAALFLSWATGDAALFAEAESYYEKYNLADSNRVFNWDSKVPGLAVLFSQIAKSNPSVGANFTTWQAAAEQYFDSIVDNKKSPGRMTGGGLLFFEGDSDSASLNPALNVAMLMRRFSTLATSDEKKTKYLNFAQSQLDYALGKNPMSGESALLTYEDANANDYTILVPYIVGANPNSPSNPHSAMASGGNDVETIDTDPLNTTYTLYGAVVGGPDKLDRFFDIRSDWPQTEIALDYNAPMLTLAAMHALADRLDPYYTALRAGEYEKVKPDGFPCDAVFTSGCRGPHMSKGAKIAMAVSIVVVSLIVFGLAGYYLHLLIRNAKDGTV